MPSSHLRLRGSQFYFVNYLHLTCGGGHPVGRIALPSGQEATAAGVGASAERARAQRGAALCAASATDARASGWCGSSSIEHGHSSDEEDQADSLGPARGATTIDSPPSVSRAATRHAGVPPEGPLTELDETTAEEEVEASAGEPTVSRASAAQSQASHAELGSSGESSSARLAAVEGSRADDVAVLADATADGAAGAEGGSCGGASGAAGGGEGAVLTARELKEAERKAKLAAKLEARGIAKEAPIAAAGDGAVPPGATAAADTGGSELLESERRLREKLEAQIEAQRAEMAAQQEQMEARHQMEMQSKLETLMAQLAEKDRQVAEKDRQVEEQSRRAAEEERQRLDDERATETARAAAEAEKAAAEAEALRQELEELRRQNGEVKKASEMEAEELARELEQRRAEIAKLQGAASKARVPAGDEAAELERLRAELRELKLKQASPSRFVPAALQAGSRPKCGSCPAAWLASQICKYGSCPSAWLASCLSTHVSPVRSRRAAPSTPTTTRCSPTTTSTSSTPCSPPVVALLTFSRPGVMSTSWRSSRSPMTSCASCTAPFYSSTPASTRTRC